MAMLILKIKSAFKILFFLLMNFLFSNAIYINNSNTPNLYLISSYMMNENIKDLYDYSFDLRYSKGNIDISCKYYMNKQIENNSNHRNNDYNIIQFQYLFKFKKFIFGPSMKLYDGYENLNNIYSNTILFSKHYYSDDRLLSYYPYLEYESSFKNLADNLYFPDYFYLGCVIKDGDVFIEPFIRINNDSKVKYSGIKLGLEI